jgi:hypothetical protein
MTRDHHRPMTPGDAYFASLEGGSDPALVSEAADRAATLLVRGAGASGDNETAQRVLHLAETEGLETLADLWSGAPAESLAGCLWRLYLLRTWVHTMPARVAAEFESGRADAQVARVVAGVEDPPGPDEVCAMIDDTLRGIVTGEFADVLLRAAAFARVVAVGRAHLGAGEHARMLLLSEQLELAAHLELDGNLA